jgi:hypothetical protein
VGRSSLARPYSIVSPAADEAGRELGEQTCHDDDQRTSARYQSCCSISAEEVRVMRPSPAAFDIGRGNVRWPKRTGNFRVAGRSGAALLTHAVHTRPDPLLVRTHTHLEQRDYHPQ